MFPRSRRRRVVLVLVLVVVLGGAGGWLLRSRPTPPPPGIVLVTIDTLRADRVGAYGSTIGATPALDRLAAEGVRFDAAYATVPLTLPSHVSMLSGRLPVGHSVRTNDGYRVPDEVPLVADTLRHAGYRTAAFVGTAVLRGTTGIGRGFALFDDAVGSRGERPGREVVERAMRWLDDVGAEPFFVWVHLYDPHLPYGPPEPFLSRHAGHPYDGEVAYADDCVQTLLDRLRDRGQLARTTVIAAADHGEALGDHGEQSHGALLYEPTIRVPLILRTGDLVASQVARGTSVTTPVSAAQIAPTILALAGQPSASALPSLLAVPAAGTDEGEPVAAETLYLRQQLGWSPIYAARLGRYKVIDAPAPELYDLQRDPRELKNLAPDRALTDRLRDRLRRELEGAARAGPKPAAATVDADTARALAALGYASGGGPLSGGVEPVAGVDVKDRIGVWVEAERGLGRAQRGDQEGAAETFRAVLARDGDNALALKFLGAAALERNDLREAVRFNERVVASGLHVPDALSNLGLAYHRLGRSEAGIDALERALSLHPGHIQARTNLLLALTEHGNRLARAGRAAAAMRAFERVLAVDAGNVEALERLGALLHRGGRPAEARARFEAAAAAAPERFAPRLSLAILDLEAGRPRDAVARLEPLTAGWDGAHRAQFFLGEAYTALGDGARARAAFEACVRLAPMGDPMAAEARRKLTTMQ